MVSENPRYFDELTPKQTDQFFDEQADRFELYGGSYNPGGYDEAGAADPSGRGIPDGEEYDLSTPVNGATFGARLNEAKLALSAIAGPDMTHGEWSLTERSSIGEDLLAWDEDKEMMVADPLTRLVHPMTGEECDVKTWIKAKRELERERLESEMADRPGLRNVVFRSPNPDVKAWPPFLYPPTSRSIEMVALEAIRWEGGSVNTCPNAFSPAWGATRPSDWSTGAESDLQSITCVTADIDYGTTKAESARTDRNGLRNPRDYHEVVEHFIERNLDLLGEPFLIVESAGGPLVSWRFDHLTKPEAQRLDKLFVRRANEEGFAVDEGCLARLTTSPRLPGSIHRKHVDGRWTPRKVVRLRQAHNLVSQRREAMLEVLNREQPEKKAKKPQQRSVEDVARYGGGIKGNPKRNALKRAVGRLKESSESGGRNNALASAVGTVTKAKLGFTGYGVIYRYAVDELGLDESEAQSVIKSITSRNGLDSDSIIEHLETL